MTTWPPRSPTLRVRRAVRRLTLAEQARRADANRPPSSAPPVTGVEQATRRERLGLRSDPPGQLPRRRADRYGGQIHE